MIDDEILGAAVKAADSVELPVNRLDDLRQRRARRHRNQRIAAGSVGIAAFIAAILVLTSLGFSDRTQGPATGTTTPAPTVSPDTVVSPEAPIGFKGLPPETATPSQPL